MPCGIFGIAIGEKGLADVGLSTLSRGGYGSEG